MAKTLSSESADWIEPVESRTFTSTLPTYEIERPVGVQREGIQNYIKSRGSLNLGDWAIEARRSATPRLQTNEQQLFPGQAIQAKVKGSEAVKNYLKNITTTPDLLFSDLDPPDPHHRMRVKKEGRANYIKDRDSRVKSLLENYGKFPPSTPTQPQTIGETATNIYYQHKEGRLGALLNNYTHFPASPRPVPHVKGISAAVNHQKGLGDSQILEHRLDHRPPTAEPQVKGAEAYQNYHVGKGHSMNQLLHEYGKLPQSAQIIPKVKYDGIDNHRKAQGDAMRKAITQNPPSYRYRERPSPVPQ